MPPNTIYVGRPGLFGNPYAIGSFVRPVGPQEHILNDEITITDSNCLMFFREYAVQMVEKYPTWLDGLRGKDLACWCKEGAPCHADILLELANA